MPYLADLGHKSRLRLADHAARAGSTHGYDIIDHNALNPEIGTRTEFEQFVAALHQRRAGTHPRLRAESHGRRRRKPVVDGRPRCGAAVPRTQTFFDIDWHPGKRELRDKVLLPFLGSPFGELERGELVLGFDHERGTFSIVYHEMRFPVTPASYARILGAARGSWDVVSRTALHRRSCSPRMRLRDNWNGRSTRRRTELRERADELKLRLAKRRATQKFPNSSMPPRADERHARRFRELRGSHAIAARTAIPAGLLARCA